MIRTCFALFNLGPGEFFWIFLIFLILFGATALPKLFRSLGKSVREFKRASDGLSDEMEKAAEDQDAKAKKEAQTPADSEPPAHADE